MGLSLLHQILVSFVAATFPILLPELVVQVGLSGSIAGLYSLVMYAGAVIAAFLCERLFGALGTAVASVCCICLAAAALLGILGLALPILVAASLVIGLGYGPVTPASSQMLAPFVDQRHANFVFSLRQAGAPLGVLGAGILLPPLVSNLGWRGAIIAAAVLVALAALLTVPRAFAIDRALGRPAPRRLRLVGPVREALSGVALRRLVMTSFLYSSVLATVNAYVPFAVAELGSVDLTRVGLAAALAQAGAVAGRLAWGAFADRAGGARPILVLLGFVMAGSVALLGAVTSDLPFAAIATICFVLGATGAGWGGVVLAEASRLSPHGRVGGVTAGLMVFNYLGVFAGPPLVGGIYALTGDLRVSLLAVALVGLAGGLIPLLPQPRNAKL